MDHKFFVGQTVELLPAIRLSNRPAGPCRIVACLPRERGPLQYRVISSLEQVHRVVDEADLRLADTQFETGATPPSVYSIAVKRR